jgi:histidine triad (HIT) family protein
MQEPNCIFCQIARRDITAAIFYEDDNCLAFFDIAPAMHGQAVLIPKDHSSSDFRASTDATLTNCIISAKLAVRKLDHTLNTRSCLVLEGFQVDHLHIKIYPTTIERHLQLEPTEPTKAEDLQKLAEKINKT